MDPWGPCLQAQALWLAEKTACSKLGLALDVSLPMNLGRWYPDTFWQFTDLYLFIPVFLYEGVISAMTFFCYGGEGSV